jgi:hypothetical protein
LFQVSVDIFLLNFIQKSCSQAQGNFWLAIEAHFDLLANIKLIFISVPEFLESHFPNVPSDNFFGIKLETEDPRRPAIFFEISNHAPTNISIISCVKTNMSALKAVFQAPFRQNG